jgi:hypothetical protein
MPQFSKLLFISLFVATTVAFNQHQGRTHVALNNDKFSCPKCTFNVSVFRAAQLDEVSFSLGSTTDGIRPPPEEPRISCSIDRRAEKSNLTTAPHRCLDVLRGVLFVLLFDALPVAAESTSPYSMNDSYWHDFALTVAQGFPMGALTLIVGMFLSTASNQTSMRMHKLCM